MASVRARVTALATVVVLVVLGVAAFVVTRVHHDLLVQNLDESLEVAAGDLAAIAARGDAPSTVTGFGDDDAGYQIVAADGRVVASTPNLAGREPIAPAVPDGGSRVETVDGLPYDAAPFRVRSVGVEGATIHVAAILDDVRDSTRALATTMAVTVPLVTAVLAVAIWFLVGRTLRPVEAIRAEVASIGAGQLHRRVPGPGGDDEVARLARTMNDMLGRIQDAVARQQRFVADASHELRSPLTRMRTELEVDVAHPDRADAEATARTVLDEVVGMQQVVDDLLHLARVDAGASPVSTGPVDLSAVVTAAAADLEAALSVSGSAGRVTIDAGGVAPGVVVDGRAGDLRRLVGNLLDNAGRHARSAISVTLLEDAGAKAVELVVADDGPGIRPADAERVFERFTRLDPARAAATGGTGLGLAIARDIATAHGGTIAVEGARFVVRLPS